MLDLNLLVVFEALLLHQNVTVAATHVGLTQSAMSNALGRMRRHFDDPLFVNTRAGMLPTARALALAKPLTQALSLVRTATEKHKAFDPATSSRTFRFHMSDVGEMVFLPALMRRLDEIGSPVKVETVQLTADEVSQQLETGEISFAIGYWPRLPKSISRVPLFREHYACLTGRIYPLQGDGAFSLEHFLAGSHILIESMGFGHRIIERTLDRQGLKRQFSLRVPHFTVIPMIVANTDRIVTVPSRVATAFSKLVKVQVHRLPVKIPSFDVTMAWHVRFADDPGMRWMLDTMTELFQEPSRARTETKLTVPA